MLHVGKMGLDSQVESNLLAFLNKLSAFFKKEVIHLILHAKNTWISHTVHGSKLAKYRDSNSIAGNHFELYWKCNMATHGIPAAAATCECGPHTVTWLFCLESSIAWLYEKNLKFKYRTLRNIILIHTLYSHYYFLRDFYHLFTRDEHIFLPIIHGFSYPFQLVGWSRLFSWWHKTIADKDML